MMPTGYLWPNSVGHDQWPGQQQPAQAVSPTGTCMRRLVGFEVRIDGGFQLKMHGGFAMPLPVGFHANTQSRSIQHLIACAKIGAPVSGAQRKHSPSTLLTGGRSPTHPRLAVATKSRRDSPFHPSPSVAVRRLILVIIRPADALDVVEGRFLVQSERLRPTPATGQLA